MSFTHSTPKFLISQENRNPHKGRPLHWPLLFSKPWSETYSGFRTDRLQPLVWVDIFGTVSNQDNSQSRFFPPSLWDWRAVANSGSSPSSDHHLLCTCLGNFASLRPPLSSIFFNISVHTPFRAENWTQKLQGNWFRETSAYQLKPCPR